MILLANPRPALDCSMTRKLEFRSFWLAASEAERWPLASEYSLS